VIRRIIQAFRPLDTSHVDAAFAEATQAQKDVRVRARALRMDMSCGDPAAAIEKLSRDVRTRVAFALQAFFGSTAAEPLPSDMHAMLAKLD